MRRAVLALCALFVAAPAQAHHVDPFEVIDRAFNAYKTSEDFNDMRAIFSEALRLAPHEGRLHPDFGLVYSMFADGALSDGNPGYALLLADEGLALVNSADEPDVEMRNALSLSKAQALGELGRYREAIEMATIPAVWVGTRFGQKSRDLVDADIRRWAEADRRGGGELPSAIKLSIDLLNRAQDAVSAGDTARAIELASRAALPDEAGIEPESLRLLNAWSRTVMGAAFGKEGRYAQAVRVLRESIAMQARTPWDERGTVEISADATEVEQRVAWETLIQLGLSAVFTRELDLATAALANAERFATTPQARFSLLVQRASLMMQGSDLAAVTALLSESEAAARKIGDDENAALAHFYVKVAEMRAQKRAPDAPEVAAVLDAAQAAAELARAQPDQAEYILASAARQTVLWASAHAQSLPVARAAYAIFKERQKTLGSHESGQDQARRHRRQFLETYVDVLFEVDQPGR